MLKKKHSSLVKNRKRMSGLYIHMIYMHHHARAAFKTKRIAVGRAGVKGTQPAKASWIMRLVAVGPSALAMRDRCREDGRAGPASTSPFGRFGQERDGPHKQLVLHGPARPLCCAFFCRRLRHGAPKGWPSDLDITKEAWLVWSPVGLRLFEASTPLIHSNMHMPSYQVVAWPPHGEGARLFTLQQFMIEVCVDEEGHKLFLKCHAHICVFVFKIQIQTMSFLMYN
jgi:hypothetical protein